MNNTHSVEQYPASLVDAKALMKAVSQIPRAKYGASNRKKKVPNTTLLTPCKVGILVETPVISLEVEMECEWGVRLSVDAWLLMDIIKKANRALRTERGERQLLLSYQNGCLLVLTQIYKIEIPADRIIRKGRVI